MFSAGLELRLFYIVPNTVVVFRFPSRFGASTEDRMTTSTRPRRGLPARTRAWLAQNLEQTLSGERDLPDGYLRDLVARVRGDQPNEFTALTQPQLVPPSEAQSIAASWDRVTEATNRRLFPHQS